MCSWMGQLLYSRMQIASSSYRGYKTGPKNRILEDCNCLLHMHIQMVARIFSSSILRGRRCSCSIETLRACGCCSGSVSGLRAFLAVATVSRLRALPPGSHYYYYYYYYYYWDRPLRRFRVWLSKKLPHLQCSQSQFSQLRRLCLPRFPHSQLLQ